MSSDTLLLHIDLFFSLLLSACSFSYNKSDVHYSKQTIHKSENIRSHLLHQKEIMPKTYAGGDKNLWSNAFNFKKTWGAQTDPRTGTLTAYVKTGSLLSNFGRGPDISLSINYSSASTANPDKIGRGWSWNLTHFNTVTNQLSTSNGQMFHLDKISFNHWKPHYHKLHDI